MSSKWLSGLAVTIRTQRNSMKLCQGMFRLNIEKNLHHPEDAGNWNRLPSKVATAPSLAESEACWDNAVRHTV